MHKLKEDVNVWSDEWGVERNEVRKIGQQGPDVFRPLRLGSEAWTVSLRLWET